MVSKNELKYIQSLCHKKNRQEEAIFIAEGPKIIDELLQSDFVIRKIYAVQEWANKHKNSTIEIAVVTEQELERISALQTANQVLAVVEQQRQISSPLLQEQISLVLDGIQDPGNLGTIIRITDWFGIEQIICSDDTVELYNPKVIQSTMGSFVRTKLWYLDLNEMLSNISIPLFGALLDGESVYELSKPNEGLLLIGNEGKGIRNELLKYVSHPITIPKRGGAESLNAAVAAGIILSHLL